MKVKALFLPLLLASGLLAGCNSASEPAATHATPAAAPTEAVRYACPMGCEGSESPKPGRCPVCDMELEKQS